jgi:hypothetical protein
VLKQIRGTDLVDAVLAKLGLERRTQAAVLAAKLLGGEHH